MMTESPTPPTSQPYSSSADYALEVQFARILDTHMDALNQACASLSPEDEGEMLLTVFREELTQANRDGGFAHLVQTENWDGMNLVAGAKAFYDQLDPIKKPLLHPLFREIDQAIRNARGKGEAEEMCELVGNRIASVVGEIRRGQA